VKSYWDDPTLSYYLEFDVAAGVKLPVKAVLSPGANVPTVFDLPVTGLASGEHQLYVPPVARPVAGQSYTLSIEFADGSSEMTSVAIHGVFTGAPGNLSPSDGSTGVSKNPTFSWSAPPSGTNPTVADYSLWVGRETAPDVDWSTSTSSTSIAWNADGTAAVPALAGSTTYIFSLLAEDAAGDAAATYSTFTTAP
jgi:hypothetical protein